MWHIFLPLEIPGDIKSCLICKNCSRYSIYIQQTNTGFLYKLWKVYIILPIRNCTTLNPLHSFLLVIDGYVVALSSQTLSQSFRDSEERGTGRQVINIFYTNLFRKQGSHTSLLRWLFIYTLTLCVMYSEGKP